LVRCAGTGILWKTQAARWINWQHRKVLLAICALAVPPRLAGIATVVSACGPYDHHLLQLVSKQALPKMPGQTRAGGWLKAPRTGNLLPTRYVHAVFTLPRELAPLTLAEQNGFIYNLLFHTQRLRPCLKLAPRSTATSVAEIGFFSVLHSWNKRLQFHPHIPLRTLPPVGLAPDHSRWDLLPGSPSSFPSACSARVFRGKSSLLDSATHFIEVSFSSTASLLPLAEPHRFRSMAAGTVPP